VGCRAEIKKNTSGFPTPQKIVRYAVVLVLLMTESRYSQCVVSYSGILYAPNFTKMGQNLQFSYPDGKKRSINGHRFRKFLLDYNPEKEAWYKVHIIKAYWRGYFSLID